MSKIKIDSIRKYATYFEVYATFQIPIPTVFSTVPNKEEIVATYKEAFGIDSIVDNKIIFKKVFSFDNITTNAAILTTLEFVFNDLDTGLSAFQLMDCDELIGKEYNGTVWAYVAPTPPTPPVTP